VVVLAAESVAVAGVGAAVGAVVGVADLWVLFSSGFSDLPFILDLPRLLALVAGVIVLTAVACAIAAWPAARRISPADVADLG
jgi:ABC-type antimicrobial peptide transport system permease subunit